MPGELRMGNKESSLLILGAGGHGRVVAETAELEGRWNRIAFLDDKADHPSVNDFDIVGKLSDVENLTDQFKAAFVAIGNNELRMGLINKLLDLGYEVPVLKHPRSLISKYSRLGVGTVVLPGAVVNVNAIIGKGCIINLNACVDHDCVVEDGVHVVSGAVVRSMTRIKAGLIFGN